MELSQYHFSREQKPCSVSVLIGSRCICIQKLINLELKQILFQSFFERFLFYKMIGDKTPSTNRKLTVVHKMDTLYRFFKYNLGLNLGMRGSMWQLNFGAVNWCMYCLHLTLI